MVPWGALEWHGPHLPLGLDGIVAEAFAECLAARIEGVLLPGMWLPMTTLPHPLSLQVRTETLRAILDDLLGGLAASGARTVCLASGHYAQGHEIELYEGARRAMGRHPKLTVLAGAPLEPLADDALLDHGGRIEASLLLALRPDLVRLAALPEALRVREVAVLGDDPRRASAEEGQALLDRGVEAWARWAREPGDLEAHYARAKHRYDGYVNAFYQGSWEEAIVTWWETKN